MVLWHNTQDTPRTPEVVLAGESIRLWIGTYPIEPGQDVAVSWEVLGENLAKGSDVVPATWHHNDQDKGNSYWFAEIGPFEAGDTVEYSIFGAGADGPTEEEPFRFSVMVPTASEVSELPTGS